MAKGNQHHARKRSWQPQNHTITNHSDSGGGHEHYYEGRTALDALLLKVVTLDCFRLFQLNGAILINDATA
eukprot:6394905-Ditylum_brightwellii.AAC.1